MDWVKQEIESKKRALAQVSKSSTVSTDAPPLKYIKRADLERQRVEEARIEAEREAAARQERLMGAAKKVARKEEETGTTLATSLEAGSSKGEERESTTKVELVKPEAFNISDDEAVRRLRNKGQPIRLFGETDKDRRLRVRALELIEERTEGQRNDFMRAMEGMEKGLDLQEMANKVGGAASSTAGEKVAEKSAKEKDKAVKKPGEENVIVDVSLVKSDPHKIYPQIYHALKKVLKEWEQSLTERPENIKRSTQGKMASATQQTSAEYLKPLFKSLRKRDLAPDVLQAIAEITYNMQTREYLRANDAYLRLSIGNAPWPIGVTMVGIHERAGREKIFSNNVGHVLNDETSRKYIQSLKRLLTFAQTKYPPEDVSQLMG